MAPQEGANQLEDIEVYPILEKETRCKREAARLRECKSLCFDQFVNLLVSTKTRSTKIVCG